MVEDSNWIALIIKDELKLEMLLGSPLVNNLLSKNFVNKRFTKEFHNTKNRNSVNNNKNRGNNSLKIAVIANTLTELALISVMEIN